MLSTSAMRSSICWAVACELLLGAACSPAGELAESHDDKGLPEASPDFLVAIRLGQQTYCSGALLDPMTVLTAAHCFAPSIHRPLEGLGALNVVAESQRQGRPIDEVPIDEGVAIAAVWLAPEYLDAMAAEGCSPRPELGFPHGRDLALVRLAADAGGAPIPLAAAVPDEGLTQFGYGLTQPVLAPTPARAVGPGSTVFRRVDDPASLSSDQQELLGVTGLVLAEDTDGTFTCTGDSGGPLVSWVDGEPQLVGVLRGVSGENRLCGVDRREAPPELRIETDSVNLFVDVTTSGPNDVSAVELDGLIGVPLAQCVGTEIAPEEYAYHQLPFDRESGWAMPVLTLHEPSSIYVNVLFADAAAPWVTDGPLDIELSVSDDFELSSFVVMVEALRDDAACDAANPGELLGQDDCWCLVAGGGRYGDSELPIADVVANYQGLVPTGSVCATPGASVAVRDGLVHIAAPVTGARITDPLRLWAQGTGRVLGARVAAPVDGP